MHSEKGNVTFVNREEELRFLQSLIPPACKNSSLVIIRSPSGFGKSTLTDKLIEVAKSTSEFFAIVDPSIRLKSGDARVYNGFYIQKCAEDISTRAKDYHLPDLKSFMSRRRWRTLRDKKTADIARKFPNPTSIYSNVVDYLDRFFSKGDFNVTNVLTSDARTAITICREYVEFLCDNSSLISVIREAQHIDHESLRFFLNSNRVFKRQYLIIEYTSDNGRFDADHEKILVREIEGHPNAHILDLARLDKKHLETLIRTYIERGFILTSDYYLKWDGNIRSVMELKYRVGVSRKISSPSDIRQSLSDLKGHLQSHFDELTRLQKLLLALVISHREAVNRQTLLTVSARLDQYSTAAERERGLNDLLGVHQFLEASHEVIRLQNEDILEAITGEASFIGMLALAQKGLRDYYLEIINTNDFTSVVMSVAVRQALTLSAKTRDMASMLHLMRHLSDDIKLANDQSVYVDAIAEAVSSAEGLFQEEHEAFVDWATELAYDTSDFKRAAKLLNSLPSLNAYRGAMLACCAQEIGQHQHAINIVRENRSSWEGDDAQLTADLIEMLVARSLGDVSKARHIYENIRNNSNFMKSPLFGYALRFSETINEFPECTGDLLESVKWFERYSLTKSQAYSQLASSMHQAREGKILLALESVKQASRILIGEVKDQHIILNNMAAIKLLSDQPGFEECLNWLTTAMRTSRDDYSDTVLLNNLAIANAQCGRLAEALDCVEHMLTIMKDPDYADRNIFWSASFTAMKIFQSSGHIMRAEQIRKLLYEQAPPPTIYPTYWEYRFGLRVDVDPKYNFMLRFDYHPLFLSHWLVDHEGLLLLKTESP
jgi:tetratricopeptide (TPR) repeat protein